MKDAKGHGSAAHQSGVDAATAPKEYSWGQAGHGIHVLAVNGNLADQVGHVMPYDAGTGKRMYRGSYNYSGTGNTQQGYAIHGSVQGAKKYVEGNLAKFWEPPTVKSGK